MIPQTSQQEKKNSHPGSNLYSSSSIHSITVWVYVILAAGKHDLQVSPFFWPQSPAGFPDWLFSGLQNLSFCPSMWSGVFWSCHWWKALNLWVILTVIFQVSFSPLLFLLIINGSTTRVLWTINRHWTDQDNVNSVQIGWRDQLRENPKVMPASG